MSNASEGSGREGTPPRTLSRRAGALYVTALFAAGFAYFAREGLIDFADTEATAQNIVASETLFRFATLADVVMMASYFFVALTLYQLFKAIGKTPAMLMAGLVVVGLPVLLIKRSFMSRRWKYYCTKPVI